MMKRSCVRILALVLVLCMLPVTTAFAAGKVYDVFLSLSDIDSPDGPKTNSYVSQTHTMISGNERIAVLIAQTAASRYDEMYQFASKEMQRRMDESIAISMMSGQTAWNAWDAYGNKYNYNCPYESRLIPLLADFDTTVEDVGPGTHIVTCYNDNSNDSKYKVTYTVEIIIAEHGVLEPVVEPEKDEPQVIVDTPDTHGKVIVQRKKYLKGMSVTFEIVPEEGEMVSGIKVIDENGNEIPVTYKGDGTYDFEMPEGEVHIEVEYSKALVTPQESGVADWLNVDEHIPFMIGYPDGGFHPENSITRAETAMIFFRLLKNHDVKINTSFSDVRKDNWFAEAVLSLASLNIVEGVGEGKFAPNRAITRAEFAAIAARFTKVKGGTLSFVDVKESDWFADEVSAAATNGWINGVGGDRYAPNRPIKRTEAAAIVNRMLFRLGDWEAIDGGMHQHFNDVQPTYWGWYTIAEATYEHGFVGNDEFYVHYHEDWVTGDDYFNEPHNKYFAEYTDQ